MRKLFSLVCALALAGSVSAAAANETPILISPAPAAQEVTIVFTNDVHCNYVDYAKVATWAKDADLLVDAGDAIQGDVIGTLSEGEYIIDIMNYLGYDAAIPGNHEFDYGMDRFLELTEKADFPYISANFTDLTTNKAVFAPYEMFEVEGVSLAIVGVTTPETFTKSTPTYFQNDKGEYIYGFAEDATGEALYKAVQTAIDAAKAQGADYVIGLCHLGIGEVVSPWTADEVIAHTTGFDAVIDGHSHTVCTESVANREGIYVPLVQTGSKLGNIGKISITSSGLTTYMHHTAGIEADPETAAYIATITEKFDDLQNEVVAKSEVALTILNPDGSRAIRSKETNLANLVTDATRIMLGADVAFSNGGGIRDSIAAGDITYGDIVKVHPFGNEMCLAKVTGQQILDALEMGVMSLPGESGGFQHVSGMTYTVNTAIPSSVQKDEHGQFVSVTGDYRVRDVKVNGEALDVNKTYTLASHNYLLKSQGDGFAMFKDVEIIKDCVMIDNQCLIRYIVDELDGVVGQDYAEPEGRITIVNEPVAAPEPPAVPEEPSEDTAGTYTVQAGDSLWAIARKTYGSGAKWSVIYEANKATVKSADLIYVGQVLILPAA